LTALSPKDVVSLDSTSPTATDYTAIPLLLEKRYAELDTDNSLHPTIINIGNTWKRNFQRGLLGKPTDETLLPEQQEAERTKAFDLIDALSRSGFLCFDQASLHVVIAATHCFDKTLLNTVIQVCPWGFIFPGIIPSVFSHFLGQCKPNRKS
jgi:hypothetical protein